VKQYVEKTDRETEKAEADCEAAIGGVAEYDMEREAEFQWYPGDRILSEKSEFLKWSADEVLRIYKCDKCGKRLINYNCIVVYCMT